MSGSRPDASKSERKAIGNGVLKGLQDELRTLKEELAAASKELAEFPERRAHIVLKLGEFQKRAEEGKRSAETVLEIQLKREREQRDAGTQ